jgi:hypothetical protein
MLLRITTTVMQIIKSPITLHNVLLPPLFTAVRKAGTIVAILHRRRKDKILHSVL